MWNCGMDPGSPGRECPQPNPNRFQSTERVQSRLALSISRDPPSPLSHKNTHTWPRTSGSDPLPTTETSRPSIPSISARFSFQPPVPYRLQIHCLPARMALDPSSTLVYSPPHPRHEAQSLPKLQSLTKNGL
ncbi:hypothetical protein RRG08_027139 [Elysia crispata]|uniref:Uncharacterized protein n=1 Tax=Elysia crispata TaxID=231223 RepID=A0AAE0YV23_9GAST|nr:hypothetical protein RRG08_027139 [Elysia crispata]